MAQLLLHLLGDYLLQTDWMASNKRARSWPALVHALFYGFPFLLLHPSELAIWVIIASHFFIDRFGLARYVVFAKNWATEPSLRWCACRTTGYPDTTPLWLAAWLMIIADNTLHLGINYLALKYL